MFVVVFMVVTSQADTAVVPNEDPGTAMRIKAGQQGGGSLDTPQEGKA